ncbi:MAG: organic hydroperoxide resistance protein [Actinomycetes bacterium]
MEVLYTAEATATGGRKNGHAYSSDGAIDVQINPPKEVGGSGEGTNPEQLFAAGYAACFHSALKLVAAKSGADTSDSEVVADVSLGALQAGGFGLAAQLEVSLPMLDRATAEALVAQAHQVCPYSNATRGNMQVTLAVS